MELILKNVRNAFGEGLYSLQSVGDGEPAFGNTLIIDPTDTAQIKALDEVFMKVAKDKWKDAGEAVLAKLIEDKKVCFGKYNYCDKNGKPYDGFEGQFFLRTRNGQEKDGSYLKPLVKNRFNQTVAAGDPGAPYSGCVGHAAVDIWAQDNKFGRRINAKIQGFMFAGDGASFSGGRPASDNTFANLAVEPEAADFV